MNRGVFQVENRIRCFSKNSGLAIEPRCFIAAITAGGSPARSTDNIAPSRARTTGGGSGRPRTAARSASDRAGPAAAGRSDSARALTAHGRDACD